MIILWSISIAFLFEGQLGKSMFYKKKVWYQITYLGGRCTRIVYIIWWLQVGNETQIKKIRAPGPSSRLKLVRDTLPARILVVIWLISINVQSMKTCHYIFTSTVVLNSDSKIQAPLTVINWRINLVSFLVKG